MNRSRTITIGALATATVLGTAGAAFAKPLTEKQWRKQVNTICHQSQDDIAALDSEIFGDAGYGEPPPEQVAAFVARVVPLLEASIADVDALKEPRSLKRELKQWHTTISDELAALEADPSLLVTTGGKPLPDANRLGRELDISCADDS